CFLRYGHFVDLHLAPLRGSALAAHYRGRRCHTSTCFLGSRTSIESIAPEFRTTLVLPEVSSVISSRSTPLRSRYPRSSSTVRFWGASSWFMRKRMCSLVPSLRWRRAVKDSRPLAPATWIGRPTPAHETSPSSSDSLASAAP